MKRWAILRQGMMIFWEVFKINYGMTTLQAIIFCDKIYKINISCHVKPKKIPIAVHKMLLKLCEVVFKYSHLKRKSNYFRISWNFFNIIKLI